jgi:hypothetical protein
MYFIAIPTHIFSSFLSPTKKNGLFAPLFISSDKKKTSKSGETEENRSTKLQISIGSKWFQ